MPPTRLPGEPGALLEEGRGRVDVHAVGIDASGPANHADTALCVLAVEGGRLVYRRHLRGLGDAAIVEVVAPLAAAGRVVVGIDAPLSYGDRGGDRPSDKALRDLVRRAGLPSGTVMSPTMPRMAYLTLRGLGLARALAHGARPEIVEVHPGAALVLAGASAADLRAQKSDPAARARLAAWLGASVDGLPDAIADSDHELMAAAAALAAWGWAAGRARWTWPAAPPCHPYDFAC